MPRRKNKAASSSSSSTTLASKNVTAEWTQFVSRSLKRNDAELAALHELHERLRVLRVELQARHAPLLLELGRGKIRLVSAKATSSANEEEESGNTINNTINSSSNALTSNTSTAPTNPRIMMDASYSAISPSASTEQRETVIVDRLVGTTEASVALVEELHQQAMALAETTGSTSHTNASTNNNTTNSPLIPLYDVAVSFVLHSQLRKRLLNRLARRLLRVAHAVDTAQVPEVPALPLYGDLALHVDPQAVADHAILAAERARVWQQQQKFRQHVVTMKENADDDDEPNETAETNQEEPKEENPTAKTPPVETSSSVAKVDDQQTDVTKQDDTTTDNAMETEPVTSTKDTAEKTDDPSATKDDDKAATSQKDNDHKMDNAAQIVKETQSPIPRPSHQTLSACMPRHEYQCFLEYKEAYEKETPVVSTSNADDDESPPSTEPQYTFAQKQSDSGTPAKEDYELLPLGSVGIGGNPQARMMTTMAERQAEFQRWKTALWQKIPQQPFVPAHVYKYKERLAQALQVYPEQKKLEDAAVAQQVAAALQSKRVNSVNTTKSTGGKSLRLMKQEHDAAMEAKAAAAQDKPTGGDSATPEDGKADTGETKANDANTSKTPNVPMKDEPMPTKDKSETDSTKGTTETDSSSPPTETTGADTEKKEDTTTDVLPESTNQETITNSEESTSKMDTTNEPEKSDEPPKGAQNDPGKASGKEDSSLDEAHEDIAEGEEMKEERDGGMEDDELEDDDFSEEDQKTEPMEVGPPKNSEDPTGDDEPSNAKKETLAGDETTKSSDEVNESTKSGAIETKSTNGQDSVADEKPSEDDEMNDAKESGGESNIQKEDKVASDDVDRETSEGKKSESAEGDAEGKESKEIPVDEEDDGFDPIKNLKRPISLVPTPSFFDQDLKRTRLVHYELMEKSMHENFRRRMEDVTRDYNNSKLATWNGLFFLALFTHAFSFVLSFSSAHIEPTLRTASTIPASVE